jgi:nucleotide-binding universal stress UspA family protein
MATIFVAYGGDGREDVLRFAAERAAASGDDLYVYHARESAGENRDAVEAEIRRLLDAQAPDVPAEIVVESPAEESDRTNVSRQKRLVDAVLADDREFAYVVMGEIEHGPIESITLASMTEAVLEAHEVPVVLVPV